MLPIAWGDTRPHAAVRYRRVNRRQFGASPLLHLTAIPVEGKKSGGVSGDMCPMPGPLRSTCNQASSRATQSDTGRSGEHTGRRCEQDQSYRRPARMPRSHSYPESRIAPVPDSHRSVDFSGEPKPLTCASRVHHASSLCLICFVSRLGGAPNMRAYSRLNCDALS